MTDLMRGRNLACEPAGPFLVVCMSRELNALVGYSMQLVAEFSSRLFQVRDFNEGVAGRAVDWHDRDLKRTFDVRLNFGVANELAIVLIAQFIASDAAIRG